MGATDVAMPTTSSAKHVVEWFSTPTADPHTPGKHSTQLTAVTLSRRELFQLLTAWPLCLAACCSRHPELLCLLH